MEMIKEFPVGEAKNLKKKDLEFFPGILKKIF